jgi:hypothetical protein
LVPEGKDEVVIVSELPVTTSVIAADFVCTGFPLSLTVAVKLDVPLVAGIPEIIPVLGARVNPVGRLPDVIDQA